MKTETSEGLCGGWGRDTQREKGGEEGGEDREEEKTSREEGSVQMKIR